ncbi:MAG: putative quinol monooxygenase, partial [Kiritimatiellia bacterium]
CSWRGPLRAAALGATLVLVALTMVASQKRAEARNHGMPQVTNESIVRLSRITVDPTYVTEYLALVTECGRRSMAEEPGVLLMYSMQDKSHPEQISILEIYSDRAAYERHLKTTHFQKYKQRTLPMVRKLELLDQIPLVPEMKMK